MATNFIIPSNTGTGLNSPNIDRAEEQQQTPELDLEGIQEESQPSDNSSLEDLLEGDSTK
jgi:hypothetical protein